MPLRRAMRWFSEICGVCLGLGMVWLYAEVTLLKDRVDGLQKSIRPVIQMNHQELNVSMEHPIDKLVRELDEKKAREHGKQPINPSESASGRINRSDAGND